MFETIDSQVSQERKRRAADCAIATPRGPKGRQSSIGDFASRCWRCRGRQGLAGKRPIGARGKSEQARRREQHCREPVLPASSHHDSDPIMTSLTLQQLIPVIQTAVGPVILISGVGLLLLSITNRFGRIVDRARLLARDAACETASAELPPRGHRPA